LRGRNLAMLRRPVNAVSDAVVGCLKGIPGTDMLWHRD
jgi:hypothetical protein